MSETEKTYEERKTGGLNTLASSLLPLIRKIIGKRGMMMADLVELWGNIVGSEIAAYTVPEKIDFLRGERDKGFLKLKVPGGAFALEVQHREKFIVEKINSFFGYNAIVGIKIVQDGSIAEKITNVDKRTLVKKMLVSKEEENYIMKQAENISDPKLKEKLIELGKKVFNENHK